MLTCVGSCGRRCLAGKAIQPTPKMKKPSRAIVGFARASVPRICFLFHLFLIRFEFLLIKTNHFRRGHLWLMIYVTSFHKSCPQMERPAGPSLAVPDVCVHFNCLKYTLRVSGCQGDFLKNPKFLLKFCLWAFIGMAFIGHLIFLTLMGHIKQIYTTF